GLRVFQIATSYFAFVDFGDLEPAAPGRFERLHHLEDPGVEEVEAGHDEARRRVARLLEDPHDLPVTHLRNAVRARIVDLGEDETRATRIRAEPFDDTG